MSQPLVRPALSISFAILVAGCSHTVSDRDSDPAVVARATQCHSHAYNTKDASTPLVGYADGIGNVARFSNPTGIAIDENGALYVADNGNHVVRKIAQNGNVTTLAGTPGHQGCADGLGEQASFYHLYGIAVAANGTIFVVDSGIGKVREISPAGSVRTIAMSSGPRIKRPDGPVALTEARPLTGGIAVDLVGNKYLTDFDTVLRMTPGGAVSLYAGNPFRSNSEKASVRIRDGRGLDSAFIQTNSIVIDARGTLYITDSTADTVRMITPDSQVTTIAGSLRDISKRPPENTDGQGTAAEFSVPKGIALDSKGTVYVADSRNRTIRKITSSGMVSTFAGTAGQYGSRDGQGQAARFVMPCGIAIDKHDNLFVTDEVDNTVRKITPEGYVTTFAGQSKFNSAASKKSGAAS